MFAVKVAATSKIVRCLMYSSPNYRTHSYLCSSNEAGSSLFARYGKYMMKASESSRRKMM